MINQNALPKTCNRKTFSQYYTIGSISDFLINSLPKLKVINPKVIDFSMGEGSLLISANKYYPTAKLFGCDIDRSNVDLVNSFSHIKINSFCIDSTLPKLQKLLSSYNFDLVLGNPPFKQIINSKNIKDLFESQGIYITTSTIPAEIVFLLIGLKYLKKGGIISYILPDGVLTNNAHKKFREWLCINYTIINIIQLGKNDFEHTEAQAHIINIQKIKPNKNSRIHLSKLDKNTKNTKISQANFINRADYSFYTKIELIGETKLKDLDIIITRGKHTHKILKSSGLTYAHTTNLKKSLTGFTENLSKSYSYSYAKKGDILIARVGTRVLGKIGLVTKGFLPYSDCLINISPLSQSTRKRILNTLKSEAGQSWLSSISKGVGARHITISDIKNLPIL
jgi:type I restriction-modification system DNA methylase subunit